MSNEETYLTNILNIYMKYYNSDKNQKLHMFHSIQTEEETNDTMDEFMEHMKQFYESDDRSKQLINAEDIDVDSYEQLFGLKINNQIVCVCEILYPILDYVAKNVDWVKINWKIIDNIKK
jgi:hypothetical protein